MESTYLIAKAILKPWLAGWFRWSIEGVENIPREGPASLPSTTSATSTLLPPLTSSTSARRVPRFLAKAELFKDKRIAWILKGAKQIEVQRGTPQAPMAFDNAFDALRKGELIVVFPEGTITNDPDLNPMEAKTGAARLALGSGVAADPVRGVGDTERLAEGLREAVVAAETGHPRADR